MAPNEVRLDKDRSSLAQGLATFEQTSPPSPYRPLHQQAERAVPLSFCVYPVSVTFVEVFHAQRGLTLINEKPFPLAIEAPSSQVVALTAEMLANTAALARQSPRKRLIQRLHKTDDAPLHRMLNVMQPGSYARPHRHCAPPKAESFVVLSGAVRFVEFDDAGAVIGWLDMRAGGDIFGVDIEPNVWHTLIVLESDTTLFEAKSGPYSKASDKDFPDWSPPEGSPDSETFLNELIVKTGGIPRVLASERF